MDADCTDLGFKICVFSTNVRRKSADNIPIPDSDSLTAADDLPTEGIDFCTGVGDILPGADDSLFGMMIYSVQSATYSAEPMSRSTERKTLPPRG